MKSSSQSTSHQVCIQQNFSNLLNILSRRRNTLQQLLSNLSTESIASHLLFISQALSKFTSNDVYSMQKSSKDVATRFPRNITSTSKMKVSIQKDDHIASSLCYTIAGNLFCICDNESVILVTKLNEERSCNYVLSHKYQ